MTWSVSENSSVNSSQHCFRSSTGSPRLRAVQLGRAAAVPVGEGPHRHREPETSLLRGAVCDYARAVQLGRELLGGDTTRVVSHGISFAGGLAVMAQGLVSAADILAVGVPTFGWADGRHFPVKVGAGAEISAYVARRPRDAEDIAQVLRYLDSMAFAGRITCPTLVGLGLQDDVVPANTVFAITNHLVGPHEVMIFPISHSDHPDEDLWIAFDDRCVAFAHDGVPAGFGARRRQIITWEELAGGERSAGMGSAG